MTKLDSPEARLEALELRVQWAVRAVKGLLMIGIVASSTAVFAQEGWAPPGFNIFSAGEPAVAEQVNDNFRTVFETIGRAAPPGAIVAFGGATIPDGWLLCDGREVRDADYPELANVLGTSWGASAAGTIKLPDLTNQFLRGATPTYAVGQAQDFAVQDIRGVLPAVTVNTANKVDPSGVFRWKNVGGYGQQGGGAESHVDISLDLEKGGVKVAEETRPMNKAVQFIIKY